MKHLSVTAIFIGMILSLASCSKPVTIETLLKEMTDREALPQQP